MLRSGATFSLCRKYRYRLYRYWGEETNPLIFVMLNPSTADESTNDPTVQRCQQRAFALGYGGLEVLNIFAYRSTDPAALYKVPDPVGALNDAAIRACISENIRTRGAFIGLRGFRGTPMAVTTEIKTPTVICAWGKNGALSGRAAHVLEIIRSTGTQPMCLKQNADGSPQHPLYLPYSLQPRPMVESLDAATAITLPKESPASPPADRGLFHGRN